MNASFGVRTKVVFSSARAVFIITWPGKNFSCNMYQIFIWDIEGGGEVNLHHELWLLALG